MFSGGFPGVLGWLHWRKPSPPRALSLRTWPDGNPFDEFMVAVDIEYEKTDAAVKTCPDRNLER